MLLNTVIGICEQLQLKQYDGTAPLPEDIQSNPVSVRVTYNTYGYRSTSYATWNLTVPASGIVTFTVPVDPASNSITMMVGTVSRLFFGVNCTNMLTKSPLMGA